MERTVTSLQTLTNDILDAGKTINHPALKLNVSPLPYLAPVSFSNAF